MEAALNILQDLRDLQVNHVTRHYRSASPLSLSPKKASFLANHSIGSHGAGPPNQPLKDHQSSPNESACGSPTRSGVSEPMGACGGIISGSAAAADTLSVKSAAVLEASCVTSGQAVKTGSQQLSASTSNIDQAGHPATGQKHS